MSPQTRTLIKEKAISIWLKADLDVMVRRVGAKDSRPLLAGRDPRQVLESLMRERYPQYALADMAVDTDERPARSTVTAILEGLELRLQAAR